MWAGPTNDLLQVFVEPTPEVWGATFDDVSDDILDSVVVFRALDERDEATGAVAGIEILDFLSFDRWHAIPSFPILWQLPGWEPRPLVELLQRLQRELRQQARASAAPTTADRVQ